MVPVKARNAATLLPIIQKYCIPGSVIYSDLWRAYSAISTMGFTHETVNHSLHFRDPITGVHTNGIESIWRAAKHRNKKTCGVNRKYLLYHLELYMWHANNPLDDPFMLLLESIRDAFPLNGPKMAQWSTKFEHQQVDEDSDDDGSDEEDNEDEDDEEESNEFDLDILMGLSGK